MLGGDGVGGGGRMVVVVEVVVSGGRAQALPKPEC